MDPRSNNIAADASIEKKKRQYSLRSLLLTMTLLACLFSLATSRPHVFWFVFSCCASIAAMEAFELCLTSKRIVNWPFIAWMGWLFAGTLFLAASIIFAALSTDFGRSSVPFVTIGIMLIPLACAVRCALHCWRILIR